MKFTLLPTMALAGALLGVSSTPQPCNFAVCCPSVVSSLFLDHAPVRSRTNRSTLWPKNVPHLRMSKNPRLGCGRDGLGFPVRAHAEVGRADGVVADENGRRRWSGEQDSKKAKALGDSTIYPIMRVYRDDLCTLEVTGDAKSWQAIEAMAADDGLTAAEELAKGRSLMTVETIIPGRRDDHSTVSTKLLAPTQLVNKTAKTMWTQKRVSMSSGNALARAFQRVVMQHILSFDIHVRSPGTVRDMGNLANEKEDAVVASLESRDPKVLEGLASAVCAYSMTNIKDSFYQTMSGKGRHNKRFSFWRKPEWFWALNKAIGVRALSESEVQKHVQRILDEPTYANGEVKRAHPVWWPPPSVSLPSNILPKQGLSDWTTEFIPVHKLQIDSSKVKVLAKGWQSTKAEQVLELHLTHAQMVDLADALDLYSEDLYTSPGKILRSGVELKVSHLSKSKVTKTLWMVVLSCIAGGVLLVGLLVVARLRTSPSSDLLSRRSFMTSSSRSDSTFTNKWCRVRTDRQPLLPKNYVIPAEEMEVLCLEVIYRVKDAFNLPGQVESSPERGAWIGSDLTQWNRTQNSANVRVDNADENDPVDQGKEVNHQQPTGEDVNTERVLGNFLAKPFLLYQVVLTMSGRLVGFQPGNKRAIGHWVDFPFAQELHRGRRLGSGLLEGGLKYFELSEEVVAIELICDTDSSFPAFSARPLKL